MNSVNAKNMYDVKVFKPPHHNLVWPSRRNVGDRPVELKLYIFKHKCGSTSTCSCL